VSFVKMAEDIKRLALEKIKANRKDVRARFAGEIGPGNRHLSDVELLAWVQMLQEQSPPVPWITPEGNAVVASPQILAMNHTPQGKEALARYAKLTEGR